MDKKILIVDDEPDWIGTISKIAEMSNYSSKSFTDFYEAFNFIENNKEKFFAYLVDMKPLGWFNPNHLTSEQKDLLEMPEKIYELIKFKNLEKDFYFMSAHKSEYDKKVLKKTKANFFEKNNIFSNLERLLK